MNARNPEKNLLWDFKYLFFIFIINIVNMCVFFLLFIAMEV